jgi:hypothetical protein
LATNYPVGAFVDADVSFSLGPGGIRNFAVLDTRDWFGSTQPDFSENRQFGFAWFEGVIQTHPTTGGNAQLNLQYAVPTFPITEPPVLTFSTYQTIAVPKGAWTVFSFRITARFARLQVVDVSGLANGTIYLVSFIRGA